MTPGGRLTDAPPSPPRCDARVVTGVALTFEPSPGAAAPAFSPVSPVVRHRDMTTALAGPLHRHRRRVQRAGAQRPAPGTINASPDGDGVLRRILH
jgi:hypothetical protein